MADVRRAYDEYDAASVSAGGGRPTENNLFEREEALHAVIATMPAASTADAAAQLFGIARIAGRLGAYVNLPQAEITQAADQIERMAIGMLPIVAAAAGLDLVEMSWDGTASLRAHRFASVGVVA